MSSRNDNSEGAGFALFAAGIVIMGFILFAVAAFISLALTVVSVIAWWRPLRIGKFTVTPQEAHLFVGSGIVGLVAVPLFALFAAALAHYPIPQEWWSYIYLGGYVVGSLGAGFYMAAKDEEEERQQAARATLAPPPVVPEMMEQTPPPFRFATWDDEENGR